MPDISRAASHAFWQQYKDPTIYRVICFMEGVEDWTMDGDDQLEAALSVLGNELDDIALLDMSQFGQENLFIRTSAYIKASRLLRLLQAIDTVHPGSASRLLIHAEDVSKKGDQVAGLFLKRNIVFERLRLLSRVFSPDRLALVLKTLEGEDHA
jgi:intracellular multiplication protein IcmW